MTYKQIEAAREARLWLKEIVVPTAVVVSTALTIPEVRQAVAAKAKDIKSSIEQKIKKNKIKEVEP